MKKVFSIIIALFVTVAAYGQSNLLRQRMEIAEIDVNDGEVTLEVFQMADNGQYYLSVGNLGVGDDIIQIQIDPIFELFIPLGGTLAEAIQVLEGLKDFYKESPGTAMEIDGCLSLANPSESMEPVTVTSRRFIISRLLEFSVKRDEFIRATHIPRSDFNSLVTTVKLYQKIHPNEK